MTYGRTVQLLLSCTLVAFVARDAAAQPYFARTQVVTSPEANNDFAGSVDVDGDWAAAGGEKSSNTSGDAGVFLFRRLAGVWSLHQRLSCPVANTGYICNAFGRSVAISGTTLAVSSGGSNLYDGLIWIYTLNGVSWTLQTTLSGPAGRLIGDSLGLDGDYLVTGGAISNSSVGWTAYVFERSGATWTRRELVGTDRAASDRFGIAVGISGNTVCVGAPGAFSTAVIPGSVHMFRRGASAWAQEGAKLTPSATNGARVGSACAVDGDTLVTGTPYLATAGSGSGRVYIHTRSGTTWTLQQTLQADATTFYLGASLALRGDGLVVGASNSESVLLYARVGSTWVERLRDQNPIPDANLGDAVATDGTTLMVGGAGSAFGSGVLAIYAPSTTPPVLTGPPGPPTNVQASVNGNALSMSWGAPTSGAAATSYTLIARATPGGAVLGTLPLGNVTSFAAAAPNGVFALSLTATNASGTGPESSAVSVTLPSVPAPPGAPTSLTATVLGSTATFTWGAPASGGPVGNYVIVAGLTPGFAVPLGSLPLPAGSTATAIPGIPPGTYYLRLLAQNAGGTSPASNEVAITVAAPSAPGAPTLNAPTVSGNTVGLSWTPGGGGAPTSYILTALTSGGVVLGSAPLAGSSASFPGVPSGSYLLRLVAVNSVGPSPASNTVTLVVP